MQKDIQNVYENLSSIKAPPPIMESLERVINELYLVTQVAIEYQGEQIEEYPSEDTIDALHEDLDGLITQERYEALMADYYLNREKDEYLRIV